MRDKRKILMIVAILLFYGGLAQAVPVTIQIKATVTSVTDSNNLLEGKIVVGSTITGNYTYNTSSIDTNPGTQFGEYLYYSLPYGVTLTSEGLIFETDSSNVDFGIGITNNSQGDWYGFTSRNNLPLLNSTEIETISFTSCDYDATAISSTALPTTAPILSDWDYRTLYISGGIGGTPPCYDKWFTINAEVFSAELVPEPTSLLLFGFGLLALRKQK